ncbi:hypothetical protein [Rhizobium sp. S163]|uniref:hypothetical protein n=1 Tax=Rhizobium sp. S163 TaxID=3055039 RepID=UPI0025A9DD53|nr:hypothetical protein [Rhizobium sp. S163]MDM9645792.1 hypothetical protein [Rhizobium sp. S163]
MISWLSEKMTGSVNTTVRREVSDHFRKNPAARSTRYPLPHRLLRDFFSIAKFPRFLGLYAALDVAIVLAEILVGRFAPEIISGAAIFGPPQELKSFVLNASSYLITAQVGVLGVISLALALVTLIAQRESSSVDVQVYYHESLSFEVVASCIALLAVLCGQLLWPAHFLAHWVGFGGHSQVFKLGLLTIHVVWLLLNLGGLAHFITVTFGFVQQSEREKLRERFTAHVILPAEMTRRFREQVYGAANMASLGGSTSANAPSVFFGHDVGEPYDEEIVATFSKPVTLLDVRMKWVGWALRRWAVRSEQLPTASNVTGFLGAHEPTIWFTPDLNGVLKGRVVWCRRRGGQTLTAVEKFVLKRAFSFGRSGSDA